MCLEDDETEDFHAQQIAIGKRFVDCWNTLAGLNPEAVRGLVRFVEDLAERGINHDLDRPFTFHIGHTTASEVMYHMRAVERLLQHRATMALAALRESGEETG